MIVTATPPVDDPIETWADLARAVGRLHSQACTRGFDYCPNNPRFTIEGCWAEDGQVKFEVEWGA